MWKFFVYGFVFVVLMIVGCEKAIVVLPCGARMVSERLFVFSAAKKAEFYYEDPNHVVSFTLNDPCSMPYGPDVKFRYGLVDVVVE